MEDKKKEEFDLLYSKLEELSEGAEVDTLVKALMNLMLVTAVNSTGNIYTAFYKMMKLMNVYFDELTKHVEKES